MDFIVFILAAVAVHRIWNYEDIFDRTRHFLFSWSPPLLGYVFVCKVCNAFWIGLGIAFLSLLDHWSVKAILQALAVYPILRGLVWFYSQNIDFKNLQAPIIPQKETEKPSREPRGNAPKEVAGKCTSCEKKKQEAQEEQQRVKVYNKRVVLMTTLSNFNASYSVSSCVLDQARALALVNPKWLIQIWVLQIFNGELPASMPANVELKKVIPVLPWKNDEYNNKTAGILAATIQRELVALGNADIITHDVLFQRAYLNFAAAIHAIAGTRGFRWWHQAHSGPSPLPERPEAPLLYRYALPDQGEHHILNLNEAHLEGFKKHYATDHVVTCPNVRDPRVLYGASPEISAFVHEKNLLQADIMQTLPVSTERSFAKGVQHVIKIFGCLKARGLEVRLVIANAHANGNERFVEQLKTIGEEWGLTTKELIFTSEYFTTKLSEGLPSADTQFLFRISNLFIFASAAEASSLVLGEAASAGCLIVINASVPSLAYDCPDAVGYPFGTSGSTQWPSECPLPDRIANDLLLLLRPNLTQRSVFKQRSLEVIGEKLSKMMT